MTEPEWLTCTDPDGMLTFLKGRASRRKGVLLACACCRSLWPFLTDERSRRAVEVTEDFLEGLADTHAQFVAYAGACYALQDLPPVRDDPAWQAAVAARRVGMMRGAFWELSVATSIRAARLAAAALPGHPPAPSAPLMPHVDLARDIFGNPFRPTATDSRWLTPGVTAVARTIYDERTFHRMPALADALFLAGCTNGDILAHCRKPGPHVRGCWVVDLLLGKS